MSRRTMSQTAFRVAPNPALQPSIVARSIDCIVERYIATTFQRFERVLVAQLPNLVEPSVTDPARALRQLGFLVETLVGFAVGSALGCVATAVRRVSSKQVRDAVDQMIGKLRSRAPLAALASLASVPDTRAAPRFFDRHAAEQKPLLDALGSQLQSRLCHAAADARRHVMTIQQSIARVAPDQVGHFASTLELLADDDVAAIAFADQLGFGWQHFTAVVTHASAPQIPSSPRWQRTAQLWRSWFTKLTGTPVLAELSQEQVVAAGFVVRIG